MLDAGYPLSRGDRGAVRAAGSPGVRLLPMTDDRVETHVVDRRPRRAVRAAGRCTSRSTGCACTPRSRPDAVRRRSASRSPRPAPGVRRGDHRRRPGAACRRPTRSSRSARSSACPGSARRCARRRAPVVGLSPIVGGDHVRGMARPAAHRDRRRGQRRRRSAEHYGARSARRRARRLAGRHRRRGRRRRGSRRPGIACRAVPLLMTDHDATAAMAAGGARPGRDDRVTAGTRRAAWLPSTASARSPRATTSPPCCAGAVDLRRRRRRWWSPARWSARPRAGCVAGDREEALADETDRVVARRGPYVDRRAPATGW